MAKITPSPLVGSIKGTVGGSIFQTWKGIAYVRSTPVTVHNPKTAEQTVRRNALKSSLALWQSMPPETKLLWSEAAKSLRLAQSYKRLGTSPIIPTPGRTMSGYNLFISVNCRLISLSFSTVTTPPTGLVESPVLSVLEVTWQQLTIRANIPATAAAGDACRLFVAVPATGNKYLESVQIVTAQNMIDGFMTFEITELKDSSFAPILISQLTPDYFYLQADIINDAGCKSNNSNIIRANVPEAPSVSEVTVLFSSTVPTSYDFEPPPIAINGNVYGFNLNTAVTMTIAEPGTHIFTAYLDGIIIFEETATDTVSFPFVTTEPTHTLEISIITM